jgi:predicted metal-dependent hydrolase
MRFFRFPRVRSVYHTRSRRFYLAHKESTRALVLERIMHFNAHYGLPIGRIAIRNQKSRWGSCSRKGNLNFNYKLAFLPPELRDYVIVHEICHVKEFNHGRGFWELVAQTMPEHKAMKRQLRNIK